MSIAHFYFYEVCHFSREYVRIFIKRADKDDTYLKTRIMYLRANLMEDSIMKDNMK